MSRPAGSAARPAAASTTTARARPAPPARRHMRPERPASRAAEVLAAFLRLGCTSFGGPVAHIGYFRATFVQRRGWLSEQSFADLFALCQFMPGPASSQLGMAIGLRRAGALGMLC